jgi:hypothetical protein
MMRNGMIATIAIVVYWRRRYAAAPSCTARAISCIRSVPAGRPSSQRVSQRPYATAAAAQRSAKRTA